MNAEEARTRAQAWLQADPDPAAVAELRKLIEERNDAELVDRFGASLEFGTAGLRGVIGAGPNRMNRAVVRRATEGFARYLASKVPDAIKRGVIVGRDGRKMSREFAEDTAGVLAAHGIPALFFPAPVPTPVAAFACRHLGAAGAVVVTASHNPPQYNGYKVYWENGAQIIPPLDEGIAKEIAGAGAANAIKVLTPEVARARKLWRDLGPEVARAYLDAILALRVHPEAPPPFSLVYTAMHGVGGKWVVDALREAGFHQLHLVREQFEPDGAFPTVKFPNPEEPGALDASLALAEKTRADLILANDPDADRLAVVARDAAGKMRALSGNETGLLLGHYLLTQQRQERPLVITTIVSSSQLGHLAKELGARYDETLTGFKWIANRALALERTEKATFVFGFEEALGYTVGGVVRDKDGIGSAVVFADLAAWCARRGSTVLGYLEEIQRRHGLFVAEQKNFTFPGAEGAQTIARIMEGFRTRAPERIGRSRVVTALDYQTGESRTGGRAERLSLPSSNVLAYVLEDGTRVTLRPSGTEPKIKYYFELRETPSSGEKIDLARSRAQARLAELQSEFLALARERGHPK